MTTKVTAPELFELIAGHTEGTEIPAKVLEAVKKFDGKKITRRIKTAVEKALPGYTVWYNTNYGMFNIEIWGKEIPHDCAKRFLLGYDSNKIFSVENFEHNFNVCYYGAARKRNAEREAYLAAGKAGELAEAVNAANEAIAKLKSLLSDCPERFAVTKLVDVTNL